MKMARRNPHEIYGRENEAKAWWAPKRYGYGAGLPIAPQGWAATIAYALLVTGSAFGILPPAFVAIVLVSTAVLLVIVARHTRGGWRWRWGERD